MLQFKLWVDDRQPAPSNDWLWCRSTNEAITCIRAYERSSIPTILVDLDYDSSLYSDEGGDYINILNWLETSGIVDPGYFFHIHSTNLIGIQYMKAIIERNGWSEIK